MHTTVTKRCGPVVLQSRLHISLPPLIIEGSKFQFDKLVWSCTPLIPNFWRVRKADPCELETQPCSRTGRATWRPSSKTIRKEISVGVMCPTHTAKENVSQRIQVTYLNYKARNLQPESWIRVEW